MRILRFVSARRDIGSPLAHVARALYVPVLGVMLMVLSCEGQSKVQGPQTGSVVTSINKLTSSVRVGTRGDDTAMSSAPPAPSRATAWFAWLALIISLVGGLLARIFTEPIRVWMFRPRLKLGFQKDEMFMRETPAEMIPIKPGGERVPSSQTRMVSVRFLVKNTSRSHARSCQAFLTLVEKRPVGGAFKVVFDDRIPLKWSYLSAEPTVVPGKTELYCDIFFSTEQQKTLEPACVCYPKPKILRGMFLDQAVYRFTALVIAETATPATIRLCTDWKGDWKIANVWEE